MLKPLYFWAGAQLPGLGRDLSRWAAAAAPAVRVSANEPTVDLWDSCGPDALLDSIADLTGVRWESDPTGRRSFGRVLVRAEEVARAYAALASAARTDTAVAARLLGWMKDVPEEQTMGARSAAAAALQVPAAEVAVKCGWFIDADETHLRTHAVTVTSLPDGTVRGTAVLTALPFSEEDRAAYARTYVHGDEVLPIHREHAGGVIADATYRLLG